MKTKNLLRMITAAALILGLVLSFAACATTPQPSETPKATDTASSAPTEAASPVVSDVSADETPTLIMATNAQFPPYEYYDGDKIVGIDAEIAQAIADKLGLTLEIQDMEFDSIISSVASGKADIGMAGITASDDRKLTVNFSTTYATGKQVIIVKEDSPIAGPDDLKGKLIGVQLSTTGDIYCTDDYGDESMRRFNNGAEAVLALTQGKIDAVVIDNEPAKVYIQQNAGLKIVPTEYIIEDYAIEVSKNNTELLDKINAALASLQSDGTVKSIVDKYIKAD